MFRDECNSANITRQGKFLLTSWEAVDDGVISWVPGTHMGNLNGFLGSWLWPGSVLSCGHLEVNQQVDKVYVSIYLSGFQIKSFRSIIMVVAPAKGGISEQKCCVALFCHLHLDDD